MTISLSIFAAVMFFLFYLTEKTGLLSKYEIRLPSLIAVSFIIKIILAFFIKGYPSDLGCFAGWGDTAFTYGLGGFYENAGFADYPPGYMYVLYLISAIKHLFSIAPESRIFNVLLKLPSIIADIGCGVLIYRFAKEKSGNSAFLFMLFAFNPMIILNSGWWGQVDSFFTFFLLAAFICLHGKKHIKSAVFYAVALLIKPQALITFPVYIFYIFELICLEKLNGVKTAVISAICGAAVFFLAALPFSGGRPVTWIFDLYKNTLGSYEYASLNAPNIFSMFGANTVNVYDNFFVFSYSTWSWIFICIITVLSGVIYFKGNKIFPCAAFLISATYVFAAKMHERYLFPALALILMCYILENKKLTKLAFWGFTASVYISSAWVLDLAINTTYPYIPSKSPVFIILSAISVLSLITLAYSFLSQKAWSLNINPVILKNAPEKMKYTKRDARICGLIMAVYAVFQFAFLGNFSSPQTFEDFSNYKSAVIDLGKTAEITKISVFNGRLPSDKDPLLSISYSPDGESFSDADTVNLPAVFKWEILNTEKTARYIKIENLTSDEVYIGEIGIFSGDTQLEASCSAASLCDEQRTVAQKCSYMNGTYFDEIYHARTGYEFNHGEDIYEWTHPPLGKLFIALGIKLFGMTPFGWRFFGAFFGLLIITVIYTLAKEMLKKECLAAFAASILSLDFMHFTMSRIATIDSFACFFALLMFLTFYKFMQTPMSDMKNILKYLFLSGFFFGVGIAVKWTCVYSGAGLCVLFIIYMLNAFKNRESIESYGKKTVKILLCCVLYFVIIPLLIYWVSYLPYAFLKGGHEKITVMFKIQKDMFDYHKDLDATHFFSSMWYQWPVIYKPMWFFFEEYGKNVSTISAFGNPAIWWATIPATVTFAAILVKKLKSGDDITDIVFLLVAYFAQYLPWFFVSRVVFIYHYYNSLPFLILILTYVIKYMFEKTENKKAAKSLIISYVAVVAMLFIAFYPIISGIEIPKAYAGICQWFSTWYFGG